MSSATRTRSQFRHPVPLNDNGHRPPRQRFHPPVRRRLTPAFGLEAMDLMGIDIDQDPRAFAQFLELRNAAQR